MVTKVQKWGNSQGLRLSKQILEDAGLAVGDQVDVSLLDGVIMVIPKRRLRGRVSLQQLVSAIPENMEPGEVDWGRPEGTEAW